MFSARIRYLTVLLCSLIYYFASGEWISWLLLLTVLTLPWLSLAVSLPAILRFRVSPAGVDALQAGEEAEVWLMGSCAWPMPPFRGRLRIRSLLTQELFRYRPEKGLPTDHCGGVAVSLEKCRVCDYLGLFAFPARRDGEKYIKIRPRPIPLAAPPDLSRCVPKSWKPKAGGGFSESHELRPYQPGDSLNQVHWKLSAKAGKWMLRQPMEPRQGLVLVTVTLSGSRDQIDRKLGKLLWLGTQLIEQQTSFEIRALTGEGVCILPVADMRSLTSAIDTLLCSRIAPSGSIRDRAYSAYWQYHIGGDADA